MKNNKNPANSGGTLGGAEGIAVSSDTANVAQPGIVAKDALVPNTADISAHLYALFDPEFVRLHPDSWIEIAYVDPTVDKWTAWYKHFSPFELDKVVAFAETKNKAGFNVYVGATLRHGKTPKKSRGRASRINALMASCAWAEYDGAGDDAKVAATLKEENLVPAMVLTTGCTPHPRRHVYLKLDSGVAPDEVEKANIALKTLFGSDDVADPARLMRLAGTISYPKPDKVARGYVTELVTLHIRKDAPSYTVEHLIGIAGTTDGPPDVGKDEPPLDWDKVAEHAGWLKTPADLPPDFSAKGRMIIAHNGTIEDLNEDLKQAGHKPYKSKWSSVSFALAAIFKADVRFKSEPEKIAAALLCPLHCNQYVTRQSDEATRRRAVERLLSRSYEREEPREDEYFVKDGHLFRSGKDYPARLANFTAAIIKDVKVDDGSGQDRRQFTIKYAIAGREGTARIAAEQFDGLNWVTRELGADACITPGQQVRSHLANAIKSMDHDSRTRGTVYAHLGWRLLGGQWLYLHADGAIGASGPVDGFTVDPGGELSRFALPTTMATDPCGALLTSLRMLDMADDQIIWPLLAAVYLAPLGEFVPITESLFFTGGTGTRKSAMQSIAQGHWYWEQGGKKLPANWSSTANSLEAMAFRAKDVLLVIDDFCPRGSISDQQRQHQNAERLIRAQGNRVGRGRMNADSSLRTELYPRGMLAASGEDTPSGHSVRARITICDISPGDVNLDVLTEMQKAAGVDVLKAAMADYVRYVAGQDKSSFQRRVTELRAEAVKKLSGGHTRTPENVALLMFGVENLLAYAASIGAKLNAEKLKGEAWEALLAAGQEQDRHQREEQPAERFVALLQGLLSSGRAHIKDAKYDRPPNDARMLGWIEKEYNDKLLLSPGGLSIGWIDGDDLFLDPSPTYAELQQFAQKQGHSLALTQSVLWKRLYEAELLVSWDKGHHTIKKKIGRQRPRVLHFSLSRVLEIEPAPPDAF